jgi:hypothetical protein
MTAQRKTTTKTEIRRLALSKSDWDLGNRVLYDLCRRHPSHKNRDAVIAKVWLIGRSYSAALERRKNAKPDPYIYEKTADAMRGLDKWLAKVPRNKPGSPQSITVHKLLMDLFKNITGLDKRSLASKYLHFHAPKAFFIYDSRAKSEIRKRVLGATNLPDIDGADDWDWEYLRYVRRCLWFREHIEKAHGVLLSPREIDKVLLG